MNWKQYVRETCETHKTLKSISQKQTAEKLKLSQKQIHVVLSLYKYLDDPEINKCSSIDSAYKILLKHKNEKKAKILNQLMKEE